ncbi:MAG: hypothetical protein MUF43_13150 [Flavobacterium sp.]|nr:hypothetical protein [Flavobacterium sp.]
MKKIFKIQKSKKAKTVVNRPINDIDVPLKMIHTGRIVTADDVNKNRSSKYSYLVFDFS